MGKWFGSYGNELWEFDNDGLMRRREASINDVAIAESDRKYFWPAPGPRPADHPGRPPRCSASNLRPPAIDIFAPRNVCVMF